MQTWNAPQLILAAIIAICWRGIDEFAIFAPLTTGAIRYDIPTRLAVTATGHYPVVAASPWRVAGGDCHCDPGTRPSGDGGLYFGRLEKQPVFDADKFWGEYSVDGLTVKTLPGVFSRDGLDVGSQLLLSTLTPHTKGKVLDVGCGAGVLSVAFARHSPKIRLTLCDVSAPAVEASRATLAANGVEGEVFASNVFSEVKGRFDMIISNPPFHDGMQTSLDAAQTLIRGAVRHLNSGGELRIVANAFLPYPDVLDETFGFHEVIAQTGRFKVYRAIMTRQAKKG
jgi:16S rRNA (guanine1207-N2)-methyltransferase